VIAVITYASRAAALGLLPPPRGRFEVVLSRMPAPIFASLATLSLVTDDRSVAGGPIVLAALGALTMTPKRSARHRTAPAVGPPPCARSSACHPPPSAR